MSYDIYIGNIVFDPECEREEVSRLELDNAPCFDGDEMTGHGNHRHPGYGQWSGFLRMFDLESLFFDKVRGLMKEHPGTVRLEKWHLNVVRAALEIYRRRPRRPPGWHEGQDPNLARLLWLEWWMAWALDNCDKPGLHNH